MRLYDKAFWVPDIQKATDYVNLLPKTPSSDYKPLRYSLAPTAFKKETTTKQTKKKPEKKKPEKKKPENLIKDIIEGHESDIKKNWFVFSLIGKVWFIKFKNKEWGLYPDLEKYKYIAHLLELTKLYSKSREYSIYNSDLIAKIKGIGVSHENDNEDLRKDLTESDLGKDLTSDEFKRFKNIGYDLLEDLNRAKQTGGPIREKLAEENFKTYQSHILNEYGIKSYISKDGSKISFGIYHRSSKEIEKLRQLIKNQINNAIKDFIKSMPMLGQHLQRSLSTKLYKTRYTPEGIQWLV
jgi:hypothetical protein